MNIRHSKAPRFAIKKSMFEPEYLKVTPEGISWGPDPNTASLHSSKYSAKRHLRSLDYNKVDDNAMVVKVD